MTISSLLVADESSFHSPSAGARVGRESAELLGQLVGDGAEQLALVRVALVVVQRQQYVDEVHARRCRNYRAGSHWLQREVRLRRQLHPDRVAGPHLPAYRSGLAPGTAAPGGSQLFGKTAM